MLKHGQGLLKKTPQLYPEHWNKPTKVFLNIFDKNKFINL